MSKVKLGAGAVKKLSKKAFEAKNAALKRKSAEAQKEIARLNKRLQKRMEDLGLAPASRKTRTLSPSPTRKEVWRKMRGGGMVKKRKR